MACSNHACANCRNNHLFIIFKKCCSEKFIKFYEKLFIDLQSSIENYEVEDSKLGDYQGQSRYIYNTCNSGLFQNTTTKYFNCGEKFFPRYIEDLKKAEHFIFLEYFIIEKGLMLDTILEILKEKVKNGVEVRLMYDDIGTISKVHTHFYKEIRAWESIVLSSDHFYHLLQPFIIIVITEK